MRAHLSRHVTRLLPYALILSFAAWSLHAMAKSGMMATHDGLWHVQRTAEMFAMLRVGQFPVRWAANLDNGFGIPLFTFVYPLPYYLSALLMYAHISPIASLKIVAIAFYMLGGLGMYQMFKKKSSLLALVAAVVYLVTPYQLVNIFVRGDIGETMVLGLAPWVLVSLRRLQDEGKFRWYYVIPLALALLAHNFLGMILAAAALIYVVVRNIKRIKLPLMAIAISLALSAFFWVPMVGESGLLLSNATHNYTFVWSDHFVCPWQLVYSKWDYWYSMPGCDKDGFTFQLGFANIAAILGSLVASVFLWKKLSSRARRIRALWIAAAAVVTLMMVPAGIFIWRLVPVLQIMQFPWRLLAVMAFVTSMMAGYFLTDVRKRYPRAVIFFAGCFIVLALANTRNYHDPIRTLSPADFAEQNRLFADRTTTSIRDEVVPYWAPVVRWKSENNTRLVTPYFGMQQGAAQIHTATDTGLSLTFTAFGENDRATAIYYKNYFPSWQATVDGKPLTLAPTPTGEILIHLLQGEHTYHVWVGSTPLETMANWLSVLSGTVLIGMAIYEYTRKNIAR